MIHFLTNTYKAIDPLFGRSRRPIELDMGCGKGKFTLELAERMPGRLILGSDVMLGRLRKVAKKADRLGLGNLELLRANNIELAAFQIPADSIRRIHLLCPDPWPKERHRMRRLMTTDLTMRLVRILEPGGVFHVATDHLPYLRELCSIIEQSGCFEWVPEELDELGSFVTDFERKWKQQGKPVPHLAYRCNVRSLYTPGEAQDD